MLPSDRYSAFASPTPYSPYTGATPTRRRQMLTIDENMPPPPTPGGTSAAASKLMPAFSCETLVGSECQMPLHSQPSTTSRTLSEDLPKITTACIVGDIKKTDEFDSNKIESILKNVYFLRVTYSKDGKDYAGQNDIVFVIEDFESYTFRELIKYRCISPLAVWVHYNRHNKTDSGAILPVLPRLKYTRPLYCFFLVNMDFTLVNFMKNDVKRAVDLIHFMSGHVRRNFKGDFRLIAKDARGNTYRLAVSLGQKILTMAWLEHCWANRDNMDFNAEDPELIDRFALRCFGGLSLCFVGFSPGEDYDEMLKMTVENGGIVVNRFENATHFVIASDYITLTSKRDLVQKGAPEDAHFLTVQWFWRSVHLDYCNDETLYQAFTNNCRATLAYSRTRRVMADSPEAVERRIRIKPKSPTVLDVSNASSTIPDHMFSTESLDVHRPEQVTRNDKRYQVCLEMLETEANYVNSLDIMIKLFKYPLEQLLADGTPILSKQEITVIFGKIQPILQEHQCILNSLRNIMQSWDENYDKIKIGYVWAVRGPDLCHVYPPYVNCYDMSIEAYKDCLERVPRFLTFIKSVESDPQCGKITLQDMLIKPVQRLPSVKLLLDQILKRTDKSHDDIPCLKKAIGEIENCLRLTNLRRAETDNNEHFINLCNQIDNLPNVLINAGRALISEQRVYLVSSEGNLSKYKDRLLLLILFNDFVAFTKVRRQVQSFNPNTSSRQSSFYFSNNGTQSGSMSTLRRVTSFRLTPFNGREAKPYKLVTGFCIRDFKQIYHDDERQIVSIRTRDSDSGEYMIIVRPPSAREYASLLDFWRKVAELSIKTSGREIKFDRWQEGEIDRIRQLNFEDANAMESAFNRLPGGVRYPQRSGSMLNRAYSNVSMSLQRLTSRTGLRSHLSFVRSPGL